MAPEVEKINGPPRQQHPLHTTATATIKHSLCNSEIIRSWGLMECYLGVLRRYWVVFFECCTFLVLFKFPFKFPFQFPFKFPFKLPFKFPFKLPFKLSFKFPLTFPLIFLQGSSLTTKPFLLGLSTGIIWSPSPGNWVCTIHGYREQAVWSTFQYCWLISSLFVNYPNRQP